MESSKVLPEELRKHFSPFKAVGFDGWCGEPTMWGYTPNHHLGEELWAEAAKYGHWECFGMGDWSLVTEKLTPELAEEKYGPIKKVDRGPRGGFRNVTYGEKTFSSRTVEPLNR